MCRYIFITGGVVSSLGKGVCAASIAALLQARGRRIRLKKLDPYLNVDPGTMSPYQHGEVFVTADGAETDLDLGYYERFTDISASRNDTITSGKIYEKLIGKERRGEYLGGTVQVIPHLTKLIKDFIRFGESEVDFMICEIGGTVGDIEALPYLEAVRQIRYERGSANIMCVHLTLLPYIATAGELKTKPTQHSVRELRSIGIQPDLIICRADREIPETLLHKIAVSCSVPENRVIAGIDQKTIYHVPLSYYKQNVDKQIIEYFGLEHNDKINLEKWHLIESGITTHERSVNIAIVGKYNQLQDAYKSLLEAFLHAGIHYKCKVNLVRIDADELDSQIYRQLDNVDGIMIPGGFGTRGIEGKMNAIEYSRKNKIPLFGICLGMQLIAIEFARNALGIRDANSTEFTSDCSNVIDLMVNWYKGEEKETRTRVSNLGGTMRLGNYESSLTSGSKIQGIYKLERVLERHRHRFEFNINYKNDFEQAGMRVGGTSADGNLVEALELEGHPWFIGVQFHPEYKSRPFSPHPLFLSFVGALIERSESMGESKVRKI
ncbi:MAG: CTP synthase [Candidatus Midichloria mitochondrii]|uniref:CTP synthase n=1 Tax=Midichloria mitochondrii (strain IricVA) TaxID=696127 RepID=F7XWF3_MIDMI|nr:CTP synthase [Candidatus Midichloria mitochondrii]AEI89002.1 CTP synthase [Candidatus Midichloria mitochondrii IricVA]MDJ1256731.1 CTP synthase [Candidatus Midichloria mitochondrii]MDJ1288434.1 CTP synthase [Candidatus Midichloria mitochondrii]MDJ1299269.1 CTP synthase [Candidatus Midichloria mitochondrii]MDJ1312801.1 CTP synthase [Candidatus Midichloria mitochondrii]